MGPETTEQKNKRLAKEMEEKEKKRKEDEMKKLHPTKKSSVPSDERVKDMPSMQLKSIENKLFKEAENYKGIEELRDWLIKEATNRGLVINDAEAVVNNVMKRLDRTEGENMGNKYGVPHDPNKQWQSLASTIQGMRY